ncbi:MULTISPECIES: hypothetical protein [Microbacterium]|uniref:Uncharacterized protein n=1 Tax=Microbacterium wangchenii TaxID=2541726 RepID=A0ABX5STY2_9MICO|nr:MULTISPECIES: hypothetical protein [Microbacterium]MCK6067034.1 hypothetical protein [Microbacterium sp. EYE_512]QBR88325.1 hypothetical protein E4K62_06225 [Microbacterium wangchenii]TFV83553.1 hypothetical protein E4V99_00160 [Microbacterium sp. dk485]TXK17884.1 hypothetical protein FVP99_04575 [Microbacterium wangchenii]
MDEIREAQDAVRVARERLEAAVDAARAAGRTWADIGKELGMTRQAAFKRFGKPVDPVGGEPLVRRGVADVRTLTEHVFTLIATGDHAGLSQAMHPVTARELPAETIAETWRTVLGEVGALQGFQNTRVEVPGGGEVLTDDDAVVGTVVGATTLVCEAGEISGRVAVDDQGLVVGILLVPTDHAPLPF